MLKSQKNSIKKGQILKFFQIIKLKRGTVKVIKRKQTNERLNTKFQCFKIEVLVLHEIDKGKLMLEF